MILPKWQKLWEGREEEEKERGTEAVDGKKQVDRIPEPKAAIAVHLTGTHLISRELVVTDAEFSGRDVLTPSSWESYQVKKQRMGSSPSIGVSGYRFSGVRPEERFSQCLKDSQIAQECRISWPTGLSVLEPAKWGWLGNLLTRLPSTKGHGEDRGKHDTLYPWCWGRHSFRPDISSNRRRTS